MRAHLDHIQPILIDKFADQLDPLLVGRYLSVQVRQVVLYIKDWNTKNKNLRLSVNVAPKY
jgi:hypothetical protein